MFKATLRRMRNIASHTIATFIVVALLVSIIAVPASASAAAQLPASCAELHQQDQSLPDGEYTLDLQGHTAHIYCANMSSNPNEYITLAHTGSDTNYSFFPGSHVIWRYQWNWYIIHGTDAWTGYQKVRIDPVSLVVDQNDVAFTNLISVGSNGVDPTNSNFNPTPRTASYANASACYNSWSAQGRANVNLTGTDFAIDDSVTFTTGGYAASGTHSIDASRQVVNLTGGGWCGGTGPAVPLKLKLLTPLIPVDSTPPVTAVTLPTGDLTAKWFNSDVNVTLTATDNDSGVANTYYSVDGGAQQTGTTVTISAEGKHTLSYYSVDKAGNVETVHQTTIQIDKTAPVTTDNAPADWLNQDVVVALSATDNLSGVANTYFSVDGGVQQTGTTVTISTEGKHTLTYYSEDDAGNAANATAIGVNLDKTAPTVTYTGNAGNYNVDQQVAITCGSADSLSGVASSTCANVNVAAYSLGLGTHNYSASATDNAGNTGKGTVSFTVTVDNASLGNLVDQFLTDKGMANALKSKLNNAANSAVKGNTKASNNQIKAFINQVAAQSGKAMTAAQADILTRFAQALLK